MIIGLSKICESGPSKQDRAKFDAVINDKKLPDTAESGMAYHVHWADGRAKFSVKSKAALRRWIDKVSDMAEVVSVKYGKVEENIVGKKLLKEDQPPSSPSHEDKAAGKCPECGAGLIRTRGVGYSHGCNSWSNHTVVAVKGGKNVLWDGTRDHWARANKKVDEGTILEATFTAKDLDLDKAYDTFRSSYEKQTGKAWDKAKFHNRIANWDLHGEHDGFVATRKQASGPIKLVGAAGNPKSVQKGFQEVLKLDHPIWGLMDPRLASVAMRMGMVRPPKWIAKAIFKAIKDKVAPALGVEANKIVVNDDGSLSIDYPDVGTATKVLVGNKQYFEWMLKQHGSAIPAIIRTAVAHLLTTGKPPAHPEND